VFLIDEMTDDVKGMIMSVYARPVLEEITYKDANDLLVKSYAITQETNANVEPSDKTQRYSSSNL
jgi:hypothetical protein